MNTTTHRKKSTQVVSTKQRANERARRYRMAVKQVLERHDLYALDLVSRSAVAADLLLKHEDVNVRLVAIGRACRAALTLLEVADTVSYVKRLEVLEAKLKGVE